ncbi:MAG: extracellular catalytic domain type 1 short-chain-length polyhydroxyalkanoate depolymerase [Steroidobacteraceae bacterium]
MLAVSSLARADACLSSRGHRLQGKVESRCEKLAFDGLKRTYRIYLPAHVAQPAPVVLMLHGGGGSGSAQELLSNGGFNRIADREGIVVLYPDGVGRNWNDGRSNVNSEATSENVDDVAFLKALVEEVSRKHAIDRQRVFVTGMSNGGFMSFRLACDAADVFRAAAPVVAGLSVDLGPNCKPARPVSISIMNGTDDPLVPWQGGPVKVLWIKRGATWSAMQSFEKWIELDGCHVRFDEPEVNKVPDDGTSLLRHRAVNCDAGTEVRLYEIRGGGHNWPQGAKYLGESMVGRVTREFDGDEEIWSFFKSVSRQ